MAQHNVHNAWEVNSWHYRHVACALRALLCRLAWSPHTRWCAWRVTQALTMCTTTSCTWSQVGAESACAQPVQAFVPRAQLRKGQQMLV